MDPAQPLIFCSYASADRERVTAYVQDLAAKGFEPWIDFRQLKAGQDWNREITRALEKATFILAFVSSNSVDKRGYVQRELKVALDKYQEKLSGDIYLIPVVLDEGIEIPEQIKHLQCVKEWEDDPKAKIADAVQHQLSAIGAQVQEAQDKSKVNWSRSNYKEEWDGLPGYEVEIDLIDLHSREYRDIEDISRFVKGEISDFVMAEREIKFEQRPERYNFGQDKSFRRNTFDAHCSDPIIVGKVISIHYALHRYWTGAAHGNISFLRACFLLEPVVRIRRLEEIFNDSDGAFRIIQAAVRGSLLTPPPPVEGQEPYLKSQEWVENGTSTWEDFSLFVFREKELEFIFPPYQVDCYAAGPQIASVGYDLITGFMHAHYMSALRAW